MRRSDKIKCQDSNKVKIEKEYLILEDAFNGNVKLYIYLFFLFIICIPFIIIVKSQGWIQIIAIFVFIACLFLGISTIYIKKGFVKNNKGIHIGYFSLGKLLILEPIGLINRNKVSILKFKRRQRAAFVSIANPEFSEQFNSFEIYLLNEKHTIKEKVLSLKSDKKAKSAIEFLTKNSKLIYEIYSPDFS